MKNPDELPEIEYAPLAMFSFALLLLYYQLLIDLSQNSNWKSNSKEFLCDLFKVFLRFPPLSLGQSQDCSSANEVMKDTSV